MTRAMLGMLASALALGGGVAYLGCAGQGVASASGGSEANKGTPVVMKGSTASGKICTVTIEDAQTGKPLDMLFMRVRYGASKPVPVGTIAHNDPGDRGLVSAIHVLSSGDVWV